jgi:hypothetical protein
VDAPFQHIKIREKRLNALGFPEVLTAKYQKLVKQHIFITIVTFLYFLYVYTAIVKQG